jgi:hypothetical protein
VYVAATRAVTALFLSASLTALINALAAPPPPAPPVAVSGWVYTKRATLSCHTRDAHTLRLYL